LIRQRCPEWLVRLHSYDIFATQGIRAVVRVFCTCWFKVQVYNPFPSSTISFRNACYDAWAVFKDGRSCDVRYPSIVSKFNGKTETVSNLLIRRAPPLLPFDVTAIVDGNQVEVQWRDFWEKRFGWWYGEIAQCTLNSFLVVFPAEETVLFRTMLYTYDDRNITPSNIPWERGEFRHLRFLTIPEKQQWNPIVIRNDTV
jgi:hypothetical protein